MGIVEGFFIRNGYLYAVCKIGNRAIAQRVNTSNISSWYCTNWSKQVEYDRWKAPLDILHTILSQVTILGYEIPLGEYKEGLGVFDRRNGRKLEKIIMKIMKVLKEKKKVRIDVGVFRGKMRVYVDGVKVGEGVKVVKVDDDDWYDDDDEV